MLHFLKQALWRVYQLALMFAGMILTSISGVFSDGWPHVFGIFIAGFLVSYFGTTLTILVAENTKSARLERRQRNLWNLATNSAKRVSEFTDKAW